MAPRSAVSPLAVSNQFLRRSYRTHVACQKLTYLCYGHYLSNTGRLLTNERPLAWQNGPAFYSLYLTMTAAGNNLIGGPIGDSVGHVDFVPDGDPEYKKVEDLVLNRYGNLDDHELASVCMIEGGAWHMFLRSCPLAQSQNTSIPDDLIKASFKVH
jgi:uncharacterized phage-associated protein